MSHSIVDDSTLDEFGPMLIKRGYEWISMDKLSDNSSASSKKSDGEFLNKALVCEAWMEHHDIKVREGHDRLLNSGLSEMEILTKYFDDLESFMKEHAYRGCPFAQTARSIIGQGEKGIEQRILEHKNEVRRFFQELCERVIFDPFSISEAIFLIYTGAMSESTELVTIAPIHTGKKAALSLFSKFLPA